jgi:tetratricopeptide (TPR) repeat protein
VLQGGKNASDAQNVVLHELAHHLDGLDGEMGGSPPAATEADRKRWRDVLGRELHGLRQDLTEGRRTLLHPPAADSMTEVFAYGTECFFEKPLELRTRHPELFACFRDFYKVDPCVWFERAGQHGDVQSMDKRRTGQRPKPKRCDGDDRAPRKLSALRTSDEYFTRGLEYFQRGRYEQAEADFNQAVRLAPEDQEALVYRAESRLWLDHVEAALADADRACHLDPSDTHSRRIRGICRVTLGQDQEGLDDLADTVEADDADALLCRGVARARIGRHREALADLTRVIELEPSDAEAYFERANCQEELGNSAAAERDRAQARELGWVEEDETE